MMTNQRSPHFTGLRIPVAIDFLVEKAREMKLPCVMVLNIGSVSGSRDGSSDFARRIDAQFGPGKPGLVFVSGSGDDGGWPNHAAGTVRLGENSILQIRKGSPGPLYVEVWYPEDDRFDVTIETPSGKFGPFPGPTTNDGFTSQNLPQLFYAHGGSKNNYAGKSGNRRQIYVVCSGAVGDYRVNLSGSSIRSGLFDATLNPGRYWDSPANNQFTTLVVPGYSLADVCSASYDVCPNSYVVRNQWIDIDGVTRLFQGAGSLGDLWKGSSVGPTVDGRWGIDISAPGDRVITTYNPKSYWATARFNLVQDGEGLYGTAGAVSAANPLTAGVVALMLEANPYLDAGQVKQILQQSARRDPFTGGVPNPNWGYGKIDAVAAVERALSIPKLRPELLIDRREIAFTVARFGHCTRYLSTAPRACSPRLEFHSPGCRPEMGTGSRQPKVRDLVIGKITDVWRRPPKSLLLSTTNRTDGRF